MAEKLNDPIEENGPVRRPDPIARLVQLFAKLPGIGEKTATRLAFHIVRADKEFARDLAQAIVDMTTRIRFCVRCLNLTDRAICAICADPRRDPAALCVVESVADLRAIERTHEFRGNYHVLHGAISPLDGIGPDQIKLKELFERLSHPEESAVREVIVATNPSVEGEATALYLVRLLKPLGLKVTRIASGMPIGGDIEYADPATLSRALSARRELA